MKNSLKTKYQHIFKNVYWGNNIYNSDCIDVINNRNAFIEQFNIKTTTKNIPTYVKKHYLKYKDNVYQGDKLFDCIDHIEVYDYVDEKKVKYYMILNSPYNISEEDDRQLIFNDWFKYNSLYISDSFTYIKVVRKRTRN